MTWNLELLPNTSWIEFGYNNTAYSSLTVSRLANVTDYWAMEIEGLDLGESSIYDAAQVAIIASGTSNIYISKTAYEAFIP